MAGGFVLCALVLMTSTSIIGRGLVFVGLAPIPGDYEIVEAGIAFAIFCFLPICQVQSAHATVDVFTSGLGLRVNRVLLMIWDIVFTLAFALVTWRLFEGMRGKFSNGETSMFLQFQVWWVYLACLVPAVVGVIVGIWCAFDRVRAVISGQDRRPLFGEAIH